jgi:hypothetical protein
MERKHVVVAVAASVLALVVAGPAGAAEDEGRFAKDFGLGVGSVGANLLYMPVKVVYGLLGGITGGMAYGLTGGNAQIASAVWKPSMGGTYVVTPTHLRGEAPICFSGTSDCGEPTRTASASRSAGGDPDKAW